MRYEFGWAEDDWTLLSRGVVIGHLLECVGPVSVRQVEPERVLVEGGGGVRGLRG